MHKWVGRTFPYATSTEKRKKKLKKIVLRKFLAAIFCFSPNRSREQLPVDLQDCGTEAAVFVSRLLSNWSLGDSVTVAKQLIAPWQRESVGREHSRVRALLFDW